MAGAKRKPTTTIRALIARGVDSDLAGRLATQGHNIEGLKQKTDEQLRLLGLSQEVIDVLLGEARPPVPEQTVVDILYNARWTCCICRDSRKPIIIHHIQKWSDSRSHDEDNLVALCLEHHGEVHTHHELSMNLTSARIREFKRLWVARVRELDAQAALRPYHQLSSFTWDYFNHGRIAELVELEPELRGDIELDDLKSLPGAESQLWLYAGDPFAAMRMRRPYAGLVANILRRGYISFGSLDDDDERRIVLREGQIILVHGRFSFRKTSKIEQGPGQIRTGKVKVSTASFRFSFDAWEATSASSWHTHLVGSGTNLVAVFKIRSIESQDESVVVDATCLAIGNGAAGSNWQPAPGAEPLPDIGVPADKEPRYYAETVSCCDWCGDILGTAMYDAGILHNGTHAGAHLCEDCFHKKTIIWARRYERTFDPERPWVLVKYLAVGEDGVVHIKD